MNEPDNHTAWVDKHGDTWVRFDEWPATAWGHEPWGPWVPLTDGPGWDEWARDGVGQLRPWHQVDPTYAPFTRADPDRSARALARVRREAQR